MAIDENNAAVRQLIENIESSLEKLKKMVRDGDNSVDINFDDLLLEKSHSNQSADRGKIIEGVFNGQSMIGPDGKEYSVPPNYASKSKLVEGDILKLTIAPDGTFVYKQIQPIDRQRLIGSIVKDKENEEYMALVEKKLYKLLLASVTYFKGDVGDQVVILVPKDNKSSWAAVENIIKK
ncbi:hypothetical protein HY224_01750 [Candidatus Uhrbacteria bacterium]|nr:hypothetical protein [Candidatus Uhrbacteria bacterium]